MHLIGILGHSLILLPASLGLIALLVLNGSPRDALALIVALSAGLAATLLAKLAFEACGWGIPKLSIESPSGHASFSALVYGCLALLVASGRPAGQRLPLALGAVALTLLIGFSRIATEVHTPEEVIVGLLIGGAGVLLFAALRGPSATLVIPWRTLALSAPFAVVIGISVFLLARNWTPEPLIDSLARRIGVVLGLCS
ncbi:MAG TPA: phosphatase PAP2 family protein [Roseiarcus sp.]|nr:phosphatase PAP2 family protein [Roseiarcus sp.]